MTQPQPVPERINPSVAYHGRGPEGCLCGSCANLGALRVPRAPKSEVREKEPPPPQTLYYCVLDGSPKRVTWPGCSRFREAPFMRGPTC
jgi:hypothetical protein